MSRSQSYRGGMQDVRPQPRGHRKRAHPTGSGPAGTNDVPPDLLGYAGSLSPPIRRDTVPEASLELLMQMVQRVLDAQRETREDVREIKTRLGRLESDVASLHVFLAELSVRMDRFGDRLERVERRLEIADA